MPYSGGWGSTGILNSAFDEVLGPVSAGPGIMLIVNLPECTALPYNQKMRTVIETEIFKRYADDIWNDLEREEFITWIAANPLVGDVIPGSGGLRKVRWSRPGMGKRGGARVIYYNAEESQAIWLLIAYTKSKFDNLPASTLSKLKEAMNG